MKSFRLVSLLWLVGSFGVFALSPSQLEATLWQNAAGGDFGTGTNWLGDAVPGVGDYAEFGPGGTYGVTLDAGRTVLGLHLSSGTTKTVQLNLGGFTLATTSTASATPSLMVNANTGAGAQYTLELSNGTMTTRRVSIGKDAGHAGTLVLTTGAILTGGDNNQRIGENGTGTVTVEEGAIWNTGGHIRVGANATGVGTLNITGANSTLSFNVATHQLYIGAEGTGELNVTNGGRIIQTHAGIQGGQLLLGRESVNASGVANVSGLNSSVSVQQLIVGRQGTGKIVVSDQATVTATNFMSMSVDNGDGTLEINGGTVTVGTLQNDASTWAAGSTYRIFLNDVTATPLTFLGTGQLTMVDTLLDVQLGDDFAPVLNNSYSILRYGNGLTGAFGGLVEGASIAIDEYVFELSYGAKTGTGDVTLTLVQIPEPSSGLLLLLGMVAFAFRRVRR